MHRGQVVICNRLVCVINEPCRCYGLDLHSYNKNRIRLTKCFKERNEMGVVDAWCGVSASECVCFVPPVAGPQDHRHVAGAVPGPASATAGIGGVTTHTC